MVAGKFPVINTAFPIHIICSRVPTHKNYISRSRQKELVGQVYFEMQLGHGCQVLAFSSIGGFHMHEVVKITAIQISSNVPHIFISYMKWYSDVFIHTKFKSFEKWL